MSLNVWETRQAIVARLQSVTAVTSLLANGASSVFDSRPADIPFDEAELPAIVVDTSQDTWQPKSRSVPTYDARHNYTIEVHLAEFNSDWAAVAKLRDQLTDLVVEAVLGDCDLWDDYERPEQTTISRNISGRDRVMRAGSQVLFTLGTSQQIDLDYGTPTPLDGIDVTLIMSDPAQGDDTPAVTAKWDT